MAKIVQAAMPVAGVGVHNYVALVNDAGQVIGEIHGTAQNGTTLSNAMSGDLYAGSDISWNTWATDEKHVMAQGSEADMKNLFEAGQEAAARITAGDYTYDLFASGDAFNSNSVFRTVATVMGLEGAIADMSGWEPGVDETVLSWGEIDVIMELFGIVGGEKWDPFWDQSVEGGSIKIDDDSLADGPILHATLAGINEVNFLYF